MLEEQVYQLGVGRHIILLVEATEGGGRAEEGTEEGTEDREGTKLRAEHLWRVVAGINGVFRLSCLFVVI